MNLELNDFQKDLMETSVKHVEYLKLGQKTTVAFITVKNGFEIVGTSGCVNPKDFNFEIGKHFALVDALTQLGKFQGYHRQELNSWAESVRQHGLNVSIPIKAEDKKKTSQKIADEITSELKKMNRKEGI
ncbi:Gp49 family protein [Klebsiella pneumoniae]|nr:Gp49 family protein [Klebsiella pneumoniae]MDS7714274.1 Gp49 family protein [Klebsiella pneumoniae]